MFRALKQQLRRRRLHKFGIREELNWPKRSFGQGSGVWTICPEQLDSNAVVYSFGVGTDISFDRALIESFGVSVHAFDPTPTAKDWLSTQTLPAEFYIHDFGVADFDGVQEFHPPRRTTSSHYTPVKRYRHGDEDTSQVQGEVRCLRTIMEDLRHQRIDLIKMDIEGGEYAVIDDMLKRSVPVGQLAVEFHHNYATISFDQTLHAAQRLREHGFRILHISPRTYEITFVNPAFHEA